MVKTDKIWNKVFEQQGVVWMIEEDLAEAQKAHPFGMHEVQLNKHRDILTALLKENRDILAALLKKNKLSFYK